MCTFDSLDRNLAAIGLFVILATAFAVVTATRTGVIAGRSSDYCYPCGMCRQFMKEFAPEMQVICLNGKGEALELTLRDLLPYGFDSTFLPGEQ